MVGVVENLIPNGGNQQGAASINPNQQFTVMTHGPQKRTFDLIPCTVYYLWREGAGAVTDPSPLQEKLA